MGTGHGGRQREAFDGVADLYDLNTFSNILGFEEPTRKGFLACIAHLIETRFEGKVVRHDVHDLWLAQTAQKPRLPSVCRKDLWANISMGGTDHE